MDRPKLVLVDDEPEIRTLVQSIFERADYETVAAGNGREALSVLADRTCDLVISDLRMPEMDGLALLAALKEKADTNHTPPLGLVLLTGCDDTELAVQAMQLGALNYILKPFDPSALIASVGCAVKRSKEITQACQRDQQMQLIVDEQRAQLAQLSGQLAAIAATSVASVENRVLLQAPTGAAIRQEHARTNVSRSVRSPDFVPGDMDAVHLFDIPVKLRLSDTAVATLEARIRRVNAGFLVLSSPIRFAPGRGVEVLYQKRGIETEVVYCNEEKDGSFRVGLAMRDGKYGVIRAEQRVPVKMVATITVAGRNVPLAASVIDISPSGLGLTTGEPIAVGEMACADLGAGLAFGEIRHCEKGLTDYRVGLRIEEYILRETADAPATPKFLGAVRSMLLRHGKASR